MFVNLHGNVLTPYPDLLHNSCTQRCRRSSPGIQSAMAPEQSSSKNAQSNEIDPMQEDFAKSGRPPGGKRLMVVLSVFLFVVAGRFAILPNPVAFFIWEMQTCTGVNRLMNQAVLGCF